jgi:hypothetical protein
VPAQQKVAVVSLVYRYNTLRSLHVYIQTILMMSRSSLCRHAFAVLLVYLAVEIGGSPTFWRPMAAAQHEAAKQLLGRSGEASELFRSQFTNPAEVLSVLLIIGGEIIQKAIAQLVGEAVTPAVLSFGWVSYTFNALMSAFGDGTFLPRPDYPGIVVTLSSREKKKNLSWVIGRLIRDLEMEPGETR